MAKSGAVWGIDIGQCALKALKCRAHEDKDKITAEGFDYIEYPKILSQPGSDPAELIGDALQQFLSRNSVKGDRVAISVSGQSGLSWFFKLPPVEAKKIPDIMRYEARQRIPFDLSAVIHEYQRLGGGTEVEGFALETEMGLFAMKRDAVARALEPFEKVGIEVDFVQLAPSALYNFALFDQLRDMPPPEQYDPENPPESLVLISLGTDATDLVITNGYRVWQRSVPIGGNHFTKALTKELKLTFAKAEHLKRNAASAQDREALFRAMRQVFGDLLTELQRSIAYFNSMDRAAKIGRVVALGNAVKLPGLLRYLSKNLGSESLPFEIKMLDGFRSLVGPAVLSAPAFKDNVMSFGACYGLALQGLGKAGLRTNLLPKEIMRERLIRQKKPWAVAAAAVLLLACGLSFASFSLALGTVAAARTDRDASGTLVSWKDAENKANKVDEKAREFDGLAKKAQGDFEGIKKIGDNLVGNVEGRLRWLELLRVISESLPRDPSDQRPALEASDNADLKRDKICKRNELHITSLECQRVEKLEDWFKAVERWYQPAEGEAPKPADGSAPAPEGAGGAAPPTGGDSAPAPDKKPGASEGLWLIQLTGYHYHNLKEQFPNLGAQYVRNTLIKNLQTGKVLLPTGEGDAKELVSASELGISHPVLINPGDLWIENVRDPTATAEPVAPGKAAVGKSDATVKPIALPRFDFVVHFGWKESTPSQRREAQKKLKLKEQQP